MNESDPIIDAVRRIRDAHAARFNYDPDAIFQDIKKQEKRSGRKYVLFANDAVVPNAFQWQGKAVLIVLGVLQFAGWLLVI